MNLPLIPGTLASDCYPASAQAFYNEMFQRGVAIQATTLTGVILQDAEPAITDRDKVWIRTSGGAPVFPPVWLYYSGLGLWLAKHPSPAGTAWAIPYTGTVASIATLDGGSAVAVTDLTGPFWEEVTSLRARFPIGAGTLASGTVLAVGDTGGEEKHVLLPNELPASFSLTATLRAWRTNLETLAGQWLAPPGSAGNVSTTPPTEDGTFNFTNTGGDQGHNTMPPYTTLTYLKRTARIWCTSPIS